MMSGAPMSPTVREREVYAWYTAMQKAAPVRFEPVPQCWLVFRYADLLRALTGRETFSSDFACQGTFFYQDCRFLTRWTKNCSRRRYSLCSPCFYFAAVLQRKPLHPIR